MCRQYFHGENIFCGGKKKKTSNEVPKKWSSRYFIRNIGVKLRNYIKRKKNDIKKYIFFKTSK